MEMHQVRYFLAVSRVLNFTRAAEECHVAQPSLTRAIKQLEEELGGDLFRRERNLSHLTEFGLRMRPLLQQCFDSATAAKLLATSLKSGALAPLPIGISHAVNLAILVPHLLELTRAFKGLELRFERGSPAVLAESLKMGEIELLVSGPLGETWDRLESWMLFKEPYCVVIGQAHRLAGRAKVRPDDLVDERFLCRTYCESTGELSAFLKNQGIFQDISHKVVSESDLMELISAGFGYAIPPRSSVNGSDRIQILELEGLEVVRAVGVYAVSGRQRSAAASTLIKSLRAADWSAMES
ncbi:MAG: LysR family transcriptional regulator [Hyphomicrobium sp.]